MGANRYRNDVEWPESDDLDVSDGDSLLAAVIVLTVAAISLAVGLAWWLVYVVVS